MQDHRLIQSLLLVSILTPNIAWSFTMANIEVNSALNQKLDADIPIHLAPNEKPSDISVRMAAPILFEQHKISRHSLLDKIEFKRIGTAIQITSNNAINVPTLDFLLEINSRKGRSYQRYNITFNKNAADNKVSSRVIENSKLIPVAINAGTKPVIATIPLATIAERLNDNNTFGPIQKTDSLAKIAKHIAKLHGINTKSVVTALRHDNPKAFYKGAHGALKAGEFLQIPDLESTKPVEAIGTTPNLTTNTIEPINIAAPISINPAAKAINAQQLQSKVEQLEHHVEQIQKELAALQTQVSVNSAIPVKSKIESDVKTAPVSPVTPVEPKVETEVKIAPISPATPVKSKIETEVKIAPVSPVTPVEPKIETEVKIAPVSPAVPVEAKVETEVKPAPVSVEPKEEAAPVLSMPTQDTPSSAATTSTNTSFLNFNYLWILGALALGLLAWITTRIIKKRRTLGTETPSIKNNPNPLDDLDFDLLIPKKASSAAPTNNPRTASMNPEAPQDDFEFDFLKSQVNTTRMRKLKRPSRYPADISDNLKK